MTIQSQTTRVDYTGNGATTNFPVPFYWLQDADLLVIRTDNAYTPPTVATLALTTDYVVTGSGNQSGGSITTTVAPTATQKLSILRNVPFTQLTHYVPNDPFPAASHEQALDKLTMETQQLNEGLSRSITLPPNATGLSTNLPLPAANNLIGWNSAANALQNVDPTTIATSVTYGNAKGDLFSGNGATVNFNLSANPGGVNNLDVSISGVTQRPGIDYTWTAGTTLTFTTAPPSGTNNVLVRYTQALPIGSLGVGQVTSTNIAAGAVGNAALAANAVKDANVDPAAAIQATKLSFGLGATGAVTRDVQTRLRDMATLYDFGAKGDGVTDDTAAIQAALTWAAANGKTLRATSGVYVMTAGVSATLNNGTSLNTGGKRLQLIGDGPGNTVFIYSGSASPTLFTFTGNYFDRLVLEGFRVQHTDQASVSSNGVGIRIVSAVNAVVRDVNVFRMTTGIVCTDINSCKFDNCVFNYNSTGVVAQFGSVTYPNALVFSACYFNSNYQNGCVIQNGVTVTFDACTVEGNGLDNSGNVQAGATGIAFSNNSINGAASLIIRGTYFEHNAGSADVYVSVAGMGTAVFDGNTFNRIDSVQFVTNNVAVDASSLAANTSPFKLHFRGNGFLRAGSYAANSGRRYVNLIRGANYNSFTVYDEGNVYTDSSETPVYDPVKDVRLGDMGQLVAQAYVTGSTGAMSSNFGIASVVRSGTGTYNVTLARSAGTPMVNVTSGSQGCYFSITGLTATSFSVIFLNSSLAVTDPAFFLLTVFQGA